MFSKDPDIFGLKLSVKGINFLAAPESAVQMNSISEFLFPVLNAIIFELLFFKEIAQKKKIEKFRLSSGKIKKLQQSSEISLITGRCLISREEKVTKGSFVSHLNQEGGSDHRLVFVG
jgi:hypothetical protein